jgi:hypothetical protein
MVYASNRLQQQGDILGFTFTDEFYLKTASSVYTNHLLDGSFTPLNSSSDGIGLPDLFSYTSRSTLQWLD